MKKFFAHLLIASMLLSFPAWAQLRCDEALGAVVPPMAAKGPQIDPVYLRTVHSWQDTFKQNTAHELISLKSPDVSEVGGPNLNLFYRSRGFRTWFENANRMAAKMNEEGIGPVAALVKLLVNPRKALAAKILAIREAKHTIDIAYYIVADDETGLGIMEALKEAIHRGVSVRFVIDSMGSLGVASHSALKALIEDAAQNAGYVRDLDGNPTTEKATLQVVVFNPVSSILMGPLRNVARWAERTVRGTFNLPPLDDTGYSINRRMHDKILLIDGAFKDQAVAFMGGRNLSNEYYGFPQVDENTFNDMEVMMKGLPDTTAGDDAAIGTQVQHYFDQVYFNLGNKVLTRSLLGLAIGYDPHLMKMDEKAAALYANLGVDGDPEALRNELLEDGFDEHQVDIVNTFHNLYRRNASRSLELRDHRLEVKNSKALMAALEKNLSQEKEEIVLISPYLWMSARQIRLLKIWLLQDPKRKLTIVTNSLMTNDSTLAQIMVDSVIGPALMLDPGVLRADGSVSRRSVASQVKIYEYGKLDSIALGGTQPYGLMHMKAVYLKSSQTTIIGTFNNDPRAMLLNSEGAAVIRGAGVANQFQATVEDLIAKSHLWGSEEYHAIRAHQQMPAAKRLVASKLQLFYGLLMRFKIWWLI